MTETIEATVENTEVPAVNTNPKMKWYIIQAATGSEKAVVRNVKERIASAKMEHMFGEFLVPEEEVIEVKEGVKKSTSRRFYAGYVFVNMEMTEDTWYLVKKTSKVVNFICGMKDQPAPVAQKDMEKVFQAVGKSKGSPVTKYKIVFEVGSRVRVLDGPFMGFEGVVEECLPDKAQVKVNVYIFGRPTPVNLDIKQIEQIKDK